MRRTVGVAALVILAVSLWPAVPHAGAYPEAPWFRPDATYSANFADPFVYVEGSTYYAYATNTGGSLLPVMTSGDATTWTARSAYNPNPYNSDPYFNDALISIPTWATVDWTDHNGRPMSEVQAPGVAKFGSTYVAYATFKCPTAGGFRRCIGTATSSSPVGPFLPDNSGPLVRDDAAGGVIDPSPFKDPTSGKTYLLWKTEGVVGTPTKIWTRELNAAGTGFAGGSIAHNLLTTTEPSWQGSVIENPAMVVKDGWYYLFYSGNFWYSKDYAIGYAVCFGPTGGCLEKSAGAPFLGSRTTRVGPGGAVPFIDTGGALRLAYHAWNTPYVNYPTFNDQFAVVPCGETSVPEPGTVPSSCPFQGQRRLFVDTLTRNGDGSLNPPPLDLGAPASTVSGQVLHPITPYRLIDTRNLSAGMANAHATKPQNHWVIPLEVGGRGRGAWDGADRIPASSASAIALNITVAEGEAGGYVSVFPCGATIPFPWTPGATSSVNYRAGQVIPNLAVSQLGTDGRVCILVEKSAQVIVDAVGYFDGAPTGSRFSAVSPTRILDSRPGPENLAWASPLGPGQTRSLHVAGAGTGGDVPSTASAVVLNMTVTGPGAVSDLRVWPRGAAMPDASNLNYSPWETVPNLVIAKVGTGGDVSVRNSSGSTHVIADVVGYFDAASASELTTISPTRVLDSRTGTGGPATPFGAGTIRTLDLSGSIPAAATAAIVNLTAVTPSANTHITAYPGDLGQAPLASNLNVVPGDVRANLAVVPLSADITIKLRNNSGSVDLLADLVGFFAPPP